MDESKIIGDLADRYLLSIDSSADCTVGDYLFTEQTPYLIEIFRSQDGRLAPSTEQFIVGALAVEGKRGLDI